MLKTFFILPFLKVFIFWRSRKCFFDVFVFDDFEICFATKNKNLQKQQNKNCFEQNFADTSLEILLVKAQRGMCGLGLLHLVQMSKKKSKIINQKLINYQIG